jgi:DNA excision repair protein ERCC-2
VGKLIYCTRTVPEMEKVLEELRVVVKAREAALGLGRIVALYHRASTSCQIR